MFKNVENVCFGTFFVLEIFLKNGYFMMKKPKNCFFSSDFKNRVRLDIKLEVRLEVRLG